MSFPAFKINPEVFLTASQLEQLLCKYPVVRRDNMFPVIKPVTHTNIDRVETVKNDDGTKTKIFHTSPLVLSEGQQLWGVTSHQNVSFTNIGPNSMVVDVTQPDGSVLKKTLLAGEDGVGFFEGTLAVCIVPREGDKPSLARVLFGRLVCSNFIARNGVELPVEGSPYSIQFLSVEEFFQHFKIATNGNHFDLKGAMECPKMGKLKDFARDVKGIADVWFKAADGDDMPLAHKVMAIAQFWALTCPYYHEALVKLTGKIAEEMGVSIEDISIHEDEDPNYGLKLISGNLRPVFDRDFKPEGGDIMGIYLTAAIRVAVELKTHEAYVEWFKANCPVMFKLRSDSALGGRTASEAELEEVPSGRSLSQRF